MKTDRENIFNRIVMRDNNEAHLPHYGSLTGMAEGKFHLPHKFASD